MEPMGRNLIKKPRPYDPNIRIRFQIKNPKKKGPKGFLIRFQDSVPRDERCKEEP